VVKALEIAAERLGDIKRSCATLEAWADAGRVTPAGQLLTKTAVAAGIEAWLNIRAANLPTPLSAKRSRFPPASEAEAAPQPEDPTKDTSKEAAKEPKASKEPKAPKEPKKKEAKKAAKEAVKETVKEVEVEAAAPEEERESKRHKTSYADRVKERQDEQAKTRELTQQRLQEVLQEIRGHMEEILSRSGAAAVKEWRAAPADCDHRELYMRLVHAEQDADVQPPEELCAELMQHQVEGLEWLASLYANGLHGILADEMGLGKTIQTIALLLYIKERKQNVGPHLIVAPKSTLSNWQLEFGKFAPNFCVHVVNGEKEEREAEIARLQQNIKLGKATACVTNYEQVYRNDWLAQNPWQLVVVDEGHRLKNPETVLHAAMAKLSCRMRLLLTGTPLQNGLNELWALLHYLLPDIFTCMMDFKAWFAKPFKGQALNEFDIQLQPEEEQQVIAQMHALLSPFLLQRLKSEALQGKLPPRTEILVRTPLSAWQQSAYTDLERKTIRLLGDDDSVSSEQVNNALMQLRKIVLHPYLFQDAYKRDENLVRSSGKVEALDRILSKLLRFDHKVLIFSQFTSVLDILEEYLALRGISNVRLDGQVKQEVRAQRIERFNNDAQLKVFLLSARAGGLGLNLQSADTVILFDLDWNPQNDKQAIARAHRVGQKREVKVIRLLSDTPVERHMEARCQEKLEMEEKIMGAGMFRRQANGEQRRQALRAMLGLEAPTGSSSSVSECLGLTSPEELCKMLARSSEESAAFLSMDAELLKPKKKYEKIKSAPLLVRCGRLMMESEVPEGFTLRADDEE